MKSRINDLVRAYAEFSIRRRWLVFTLVTALLAVTGFGLPKLSFDTRYRIWFEEGSEALIAYDLLLERFGSDDQVLVVFRDPERGLMHNEALASVRRLTERFWGVKGVKRVDSLANYAVTKASSIDNESPGLAVTAGYVAAAGDRNDIYLWDSVNWSKRRLAGHSGQVERLAFSPDGSRLYSGSNDRSIRVWDVETGDLIRVLRGLTQGVSAIKLSKDGRRLYAGTYKSVFVWDTASGKQLFRWDGHSDFVTALHPSPSGERVYSASRDIFVWDANSGKAIKRLAGGPRFINAISVLDDDSVLVSAGEDGAVRKWMLGTGRASDLLEASKDRAALCMIMMPGQKSVAVGLSDGSILTLPLDGTAAIVSRIHNDWVVDMAVDDRSRVFSASRDKNVSVHIPGQGPKMIGLAAHRASVRRVLIGPQGRLFTSGDDGDLYVWSKGDQEMLARLRRTSSPEIGAPLEVIGSPDGIILVENSFRYPIEITVNGKSAGRVDGGSSLEIKGLLIASRTVCEDDSQCQTGQYCDYEKEEPICAGTSVVEARVPGSSRPIWRGEAFLSPHKQISVRIPSDEPFSVAETTKSAVDPLGRVGNFVAKFPEAAVQAWLAKVLGSSLDDPNTYISPQVARDLEAQIPATGISEAASNWITSQAQFKLNPLQSPVQPYRIREATHHLMRQPSPAGLGLVLNEDLDTSMIVVSIHQPEPATALKRGREIREEIRAILDSEKKTTNYKYYLSGGIVMDTTMEDYALRDANELTPIFLFVIIVLLSLAYRRASGVFLPLGLITVSICIALGFAGLLGASLNNLTVAVPQVVLASCIGDAVHVFNCYVDKVREGYSPHDASVESVTTNFYPCLWTSVSTSVGFFSLASSPILPVAAFGWMSGIGVICAFGMSLTLMPAITSMLPVPKAKKKATSDTSPVTEAKGFDARFDSTLVRLAAWVNRNTGLIMFSGAVAVAVGSLGVSKLVIDTNDLKFFDKSAPFRQAAEFLEDHISGSYGLSLMVTFEDPKTGDPIRGAIRKKENLKEIEKLHDYVSSFPEVVNVASLSPIMKSMNRVMSNDLYEDFRIPDTDAKVSSYYNAYTFSLSAGKEITNRVSADESSTLIDLRMMSGPSSWF